MSHKDAKTQRIERICFETNNQWWIQRNSVCQSNFFYG